MRFAERFLIVLSIISLLMRYWGLKDGPTMELLVLPALALFYLLFLPFIVVSARRIKSKGQSNAWTYIGAFLAGAVLAYCILSAMFYTLKWLAKADMLENCSILLGLLCLITVGGWKRNNGTGNLSILLRAAILLAAIWLIGILPLPEMTALQR